eukprot:5702201-Pleurochrysis_carterae.AAC.1
MEAKYFSLLTRQLTSMSLSYVGGGVMANLCSKWERNLSDERVRARAAKAREHASGRRVQKASLKRAAPCRR